MTWTTSADLRAQVQKLWDRGELPAVLVDGSPFFPRRLSLKGPTSSELGERFEQVRAWIAELRQTPHCRVVMRDLRHRVIGSNSIPHEIWIDTPDDALALIAKRRDAQKLSEVVNNIRNRKPELLPWLARHALQALELAEDWPRLLDVIAWMKAHPSPGIYLRQIDLPGVHSKFIEANRGVLSELLDIVLPADSIDAQATGIGQFSRRYGFREKPSLVRFRVLDPSLALLAAGAEQDITLNADAFSQLNMDVRTVFITENETNFLAFPQVPGGLVIFGAGYGFDMLASAVWLRRCTIYYWGDIDTHGFAILDQLRAYLAHAQSLLMDREVLMSHQPLWGSEPKPERKDLVRLTPVERALYDDLRDNRIGNRVRLEQERVDFGSLKRAIQALAPR